MPTYRDTRDTSVSVVGQNASFSPDSVRLVSLFFRFLPFLLIFPASFISQIFCFTAFWKLEGTRRDFQFPLDYESEHATEHSGSEQPRIGTEQLGHLLVHSLNPSHSALIRSPRPARLTLD